MYWRFFLKSRFVIKIATTDQQLWGKLNQRVVGKADRAQPCTRSHFILGSNLLSINRNKLTYFHCLLSTSSATIKLCGFPPPLINRTKNFPLHFQLVSLLPPKVLLEDWWLMMAMLKKGIQTTNDDWWVMRTFQPSNSIPTYSSTTPRKAQNDSWRTRTTSNELRSS